jgi:hypothetical protein
MAIRSEEVEMAVNDHQIADLESWIQSTGSIGSDQAVRSQPAQNMDRKLDLTPGATLIAMASTLHQRDLQAA